MVLIQPDHLKILGTSPASVPIPNFTSSDFTIINKFSHDLAKFDFKNSGLC